MDNVIALLKKYKAGKITEEQVSKALENLLVEDMEFAQIDHHRHKRQGFPEVIYCPVCGLVQPA